jgi:hypothetical protein
MARWVDPRRHGSQPAPWVGKVFTVLLLNILYISAAQVARWASTAPGVLEACLRLTKILAYI